MDLVTELVVLAVSLAGTVFLARLEHANRLPRLVANDGTLSALVGALTVGICFGLIGLVFKVETITGSPLIDAAIAVGVCVAIAWFLVLATAPRRRHEA